MGKTSRATIRIHAGGAMTCGYKRSFKLRLRWHKASGRLIE